jgi:hypothetical protein
MNYSNLQTTPNWFWNSCGGRGVCVKLGKEYCTFIPAYDEDGRSISKILDDMTKVRDDLWQDEQAKNKPTGWGFRFDH